MAAMDVIESIAAVLTIISAVCSVITLVKTRKIKNEVVKQSVGFICADLRKAQAHFNEVCLQDDRETVLASLRDISTELDRLYNAYNYINDKKALDKIEDADDRIRDVQRLAGSLKYEYSIANKMNQAIDALY